MRIFCLLIALLWAGSSSAAVYKWVDTEGVVHYGDSPPASGAKPIDLPEVSSYTSTPVPPASSAAKGALANVFKGYDSLTITRPKDDETIRSNEGLVQVDLVLSPGLQRGHSLQLFLDGKLVSDNVGAGVQLKGVMRGAHELTAVVVDKDGKAWIRSSPVRFYLLKVSLLNKPAKSGASTSPIALPGGIAAETEPAATAAGATTTPFSSYAPAFAPGYTP